MTAGIQLAAMAMSGLLAVAPPPITGTRSNSKAAAPVMTKATPLAAFTFITAASSSPATINFNLTDPDAAAVAGSGSVIWTTVFASSAADAWNVTVSSGGAAAFTNCPEIPISAVTFTCASVSGPSGGTCDGQKTLTTTGVETAHGFEYAGAFFGYTTTVNVIFTITDAWKYKGHTTTPCTLNVTYTITAN